jgi:hypothetical protein
MNDERHKKDTLTSAVLHEASAQNVVSWAKEGRPIYPVVEGRQG